MNKPLNNKGFTLLIIIVWIAIVLLIVLAKGCFSAANAAEVESLNEEYKISVIVHRDNSFTLSGLDYGVIINGQYVGDIKVNSEKKFIVDNSMYGENEIYFTLPNINIARKKYSFKADIGDTVRLYIGVDLGFFQSDVDFIKFEKVIIAKQYRDMEAVLYNEISGDKSLVPAWFKASTLKSLDSVQYKNRYSFWAPFIQCQPLLRVMALCVVLYPVFSYSIYLFLRSGNYSDSAFLTILLFAFPMALLLTYPVGYVLNVLVDFALYAATGENYTVSLYFILFLLVCLVILFFLIFSVSPLRKAIHSANLTRRTLGQLAFIVEAIGILYTLKDFIIDIVSLFI